MTTLAEIESKVASAILHSVQNGCDMTPREALVAAKAALAALTPGAGYAAGIEDARFGPVCLETCDSWETGLCTCGRSLPQPPPAEDALRAENERLRKALEPFLVTQESWLDEWPDDALMSHFRRVTFGQYRAARQALTGTKGDGG